ncbi:hypothetical protein HYZ41_02135 [archaeon]|nr:hypothetical protein [archaeon]
MKKYIVPLFAGAAALFLVTDEVTKAEIPRNPEEINYTLSDTTAALMKQLDIFVKTYGQTSGMTIDGITYNSREAVLENKYLMQSFEGTVYGKEISYLSIIRKGADCFYFGDIHKDGKIDIFTKKRSGIDDIFISDAMSSALKFAASGNKDDLIDDLNLAEGKKDAAFMKAALEIMKLPEFKSGPKGENVK